MLTRNDRLAVKPQHCPYAPLVTFKQGITAPLPNAPYPGSSIPAPTNDVTTFYAHVQGTYIMGISQQQGFRVLFWWFTGLPYFYYSVFAARYYEPVLKG